MIFYDLKLSTKNWRFIHLLGVTNLRSRYSRSKLGQTWLTLSFFIQIMSIGTVWSVLWKQPVLSFLPYVALGMILYQFFSMIILESTTVFTNDSRLYMNQHLPFFTSIFSLIYKNTLVFLHNIPILILFLVISGAHANASLLMVYGFILLCFFLTSCAYVLACLCTRYRDMIQIINSVMNVLFLVTPIMWNIEQIPQQWRAYFFMNPLAAFLEIFRNPLLDLPVNYFAYVSATSWASLTVGLMFFLYHRFEKRIIYWI